MIKTRFTDSVGIRLPILQAPMGWIARSQLASAVSNAGGMGMIETSSGELDNIKREIEMMRSLTDQPFAVNIAQAFVRDPNIVSFIIDQGVKFVTTSAGSPERFTDQLKQAGLTVYHVVPSLAAAKKAVECGVDGLIVEGAEGGGFKNPKDVTSLVLLPLIREHLDVPIIAAGGFHDGATLAAALALGADGIQLGTRMVASLESPVHINWKEAIVRAKETDTVFLSRFAPPALRALRTERTSRLEKDPSQSGMADFGDPQALYFGGDMEAAIPLTGQVCGRINEIESVQSILAKVEAEYEAALQRVSGAVC
jgi:enoyl-[acyl-carrier protein] reductase II